MLGMTVYQYFRFSHTQQNKQTKHGRTTTTATTTTTTTTATTTIKSHFLSGFKRSKVPSPFPSKY